MPRLELSQNLDLSQRLDLVMAPHQIQALEILLATIPELEQKISQELAENPTLELVGTGAEDLVGNPVEENTTGGEEEAEAAAEAAEKDEAIATLIQLEENWRDYGSPPRSRRSSNSADAQERRQYMFDSLTVEPTLQDVLLEQLRETDEIDENREKICRQVIGSIDESGYLRTHPSDIAVTASADLGDVMHAVELVQSFDPAGVGARDLRECLLLQLERKGEEDSLEYEVVEKHIDEVARNHIPKITKALRISSTRLYDALRRIRKLTPYPGSLVAPVKMTDYVYPEIFIEKDRNGEWIVRSNKEYSPRLKISKHYMKLLRDPDTPTHVKKYVRDKIGNSKLLLRAIDQRRSTIEEIGECLLKFQRDFFEKGESQMRPLIMSRVADEIGVHETTVSRAIANKYVQTPHGLFPFKHFFNTGYENEDGTMVSSVGIKERLKSLIESEDKAHPFSDRKLADLLKEEGFKVARRTVAKYREEEGIPSSNLRRSY